MNISIATAAISQPAIIERLRQIPFEFWWKIGLGIVVVFAAVILLRKIANVNPFVLAMVVLLAVTTVGFNWIHERNEPSWATPLVRLVAGFFPGKVRT